MFMSNGVLDNQGAVPTDPTLPIGIVFAISRDLGTIQATQDPVVFVLGYTTDPAISYPAQPGIPAQQRRPYYKLKYSDDESLVTPRIFGVEIILIYPSDSRFSKRFRQCFEKGSATGSENTRGCCFCLQSARRPGFPGSPPIIWQHPADHWNRCEWWI